MDEVLELLRRVDSKLNDIQAGLSPQRYLSRSEYAERYGLSERTVDRMLKTGKLPHRKAGKRVLIDANAQPPAETR